MNAILKSVKVVFEFGVKVVKTRGDKMSQTKLVIRIFWFKLDYNLWNDNLENDCLTLCERGLRFCGREKLKIEWHEILFCILFLIRSLSLKMNKWGYRQSGESFYQGGIGGTPLFFLVFFNTMLITISIKSITKTDISYTELGTITLT